MKTNLVINLVLAILCTFTWACQEEAVTPKIEAQEKASASEVAQVQSEFDEVAQMGIVALEESGVSNKTANNFFDPCVNIVLDTTARTLVLDFGAGCTGSGGITRAGSIEIRYIGKYREPGALFSTTFYDYSVNGNTLSGSLEVSSMERDLYGNLAFSYEVKNGSLSFADGRSINYEAERTFTWIEGENSGDPLNNVYQVRGSSSGENSEGAGYTSEITTPLELKAACTAEGIIYPTSGRININFRAIPRPMTVDFGEGNCDREVELLINNQSVSLGLGR